MVRNASSSISNLRASSSSSSSSFPSATPSQASTSAADADAAPRVNTRTLQQKMEAGMLRGRTGGDTDALWGVEGNATRSNGDPVQKSNGWAAEGNFTPSSTDDQMGYPKPAHTQSKAGVLPSTLFSSYEQTQGHAPAAATQPSIDHLTNIQRHAKLPPADISESWTVPDKETSLYEKFMEETEQAMKNLTTSLDKTSASNPVREASLFKQYQEAVQGLTTKRTDGTKELPTPYVSADWPPSTGRPYNQHQFLGYPPISLPPTDARKLSARSYDKYMARPSPIIRSNAEMSNNITEIKPNGTSLITKGFEREVKEQNVLKSPEAYTQPFCDFLTDNPTVWHAVQYFEKKLDAAGFKKLSERQTWTSTLKKGGKYYITRNGSSLIAFAVGSNYMSGNGVAMIAGHVDALTARLKPVSTKTTKAGYVQLGVAPYAGALNSTWWDRDLGIGGRVLVKDGTTGKIETKLVNLGWPIARIPTLAPHFGVGMTGENNTETEAVPIIGLDSSPPSTGEFENLTLGGVGSFTATQPPKLVRAIAGELSIQDYRSIVNWELELYDTQPAQVGGLEKEFIFAGRIDDKLCSWSAMEALLASSSSTSADDGIVKLVGVFDDEEIGSLLRQGARGNFLPSTIERISESFAPSSSANVLSQTYANSFLISSDVTHAVNPNFLSRYLENHAPRLNVGLVVCVDSNGHMTSDSVSTALLTRVAEKSDSDLQFFMIRNDSRSGGTVGPMLSSAMGVRAIDAGIAQLSMHSIRATTGALDPGLGVKLFAGFFDHFQAIDREFE